MRARGWIVLLALAASLLAQTASAAKTGYEDKRFQLTPFGGWTLFDDKLLHASGQELEDAAYIGGRVAVRLGGIVWLEGAGGTTSTKLDGGGDDVRWYHASGNLLFSPSTAHALSPFVSLGGGAWNISHKGTGVVTFVPVVGGGDEKLAAFEVAAGARLRLTDIVGLRLEARNVLALPKGNPESASVNNIVLGAGLSFSFGGGRLRDEDGDGVPDKTDKCPGTTVGCQVDATGCTTDADGDGVCDGVDQCSNTPTGCQVDERGCPKDTDGDGVCDGLDKCANTSTGLRVDKDGCPIEITERETELLDTGMIRISDINFETGKTDIPADAEGTLNVVGEVLSKWPEIKMEIGGHTDSRGSVAYNQGLSDGRAAAVRNYLLEHFPQLHAEQLTSKGYGELKPLVPNTSALNMARNRRVEIKVLNKQELKKEVERRRLLNK